MKKYTIYQITNIIDGKIYIGKHETFDINDSYMGSGKILKSAQSKHGIENFKKHILHIFDNEDEMNAKEAELVTEEFCSRDDTYNLCPGGKGGWGYVNQNSLNFGEDPISARKRGRCTTDEILKLRHGDDFRHKVMNQPAMKAGLKRYYLNGNPGAFKGKLHTNETKSLIGAKTSKYQSGNGNSQFGSMWITNGSENKKIKSTDIIPEGWYKGRKIK